MNIYDTVANEIESKRMLQRSENRETNYIVMSKPMYSVFRRYCNKMLGRDINNIGGLIEISTYKDMGIIVLDIDDLTLVIG